jgi:hypothetical protein
MNQSQRAVRWLAVLALFAMARSAEAVPPFRTAFGVDSALGGSMDFTQFIVNYNMGMIELTAHDSSATTSYLDVGLPFQFFYPGNSAGNPIGNGFNYLGGGRWQNSAATQELDVLSVNPPFTMISQSLNPALIRVPLTDMIGSFSASISSSDSVPLIELGDFAPGQSKSFVVNFDQPIGGGPTHFNFVASAFFVAIPEPSTIALSILAGLTTIIAVSRRRPRSAERSAT